MRVVGIEEGDSEVAALGLDKLFVPYQAEEAVGEKASLLDPNLIVDWAHGGVIVGEKGGAVGETIVKVDKGEVECTGEICVPNGVMPQDVVIARLSILN